MDKARPTVACIVTFALASAVPAGAHTVGPTTLGAIAPGTLYATGVGTVGVGVCQNLPTFGGALPLFCGVNGLGAFFDVSSVNCDGTAAGGCGAADSHSHANGSCRVDQGIPMLLGDDYYYLCGTDRNDDGVVSDANVCEVEDDTTPHFPSGVTNHDECSGETAVRSTLGPRTFQGVNDHWADDWVEGCVGPTCPRALPSGATQNFCFQDDVQGFTPFITTHTGQAGDDVTALNQAGGGWDDVVVFVGAVVDTAVLFDHVGSVHVTLTITGASACISLANVSAHRSPGNTRAELAVTSGACGLYCLDILGVT